MYFEIVFSPIALSAGARIGSETKNVRKLKK
jgi:hypothetical protein